MEITIAFSCGFVCCAVLCGLMHYITPSNTPQVPKTSFFPKASKEYDPSKKSVIVLDQKHEDDMEDELG